MTAAAQETSRAVEISDTALQRNPAGGDTREPKPERGLCVAPVRPARSLQTSTPHLNAAIARVKWRCSSLPVVVLLFLSNTARVSNIQLSVR